MKNIFKLMALFAFLFCFSSCEDDEPVISTLEVTPANLEGTWKLAEWNGASLDEGTYCYVIFNRKEQTFEMYQKFDSMYARYITGSFSIETILIWVISSAEFMTMVTVTGTINIS